MWHNSHITRRLWHGTKSTRFATVMTIDGNKCHGWLHSNPRWSLRWTWKFKAAHISHKINCPPLLSKLISSPCLQLRYYANKRPSNKYSQSNENKSFSLFFFVITIIARIQHESVLWCWADSVAHRVASARKKQQLHALNKHRLSCLYNFCPKSKSHM